MALRQANYPVIRDSQGEQTNPTTSTVLADTGAIPLGGIYEITVISSASALGEFLIARRNAANDANVGDTVHFYSPASTTVAFVLPFEIEKNERVRVIPQANLTGDAVVTVVAQRVG